MKTPLVFNSKLLPTDDHIGNIGRRIESDLYVLLRSYDQLKRQNVELKKENKQLKERLKTHNSEIV